ncbi:MAG: hypothetical protein KDK89_19815 [Alphaproteobacteria bacterium]|nr:hypothetical protein [Alphaproteobacteria bacterium]
MTSDFIARDAMLDVCPDFRCRRSGDCQRAQQGLPCRRSHESRDAFRVRLAAKLDRLAAAAPCRSAASLTPEERGRALARFKAALEARERELAAPLAEGPDDR